MKKKSLPFRKNISGIVVNEDNKILLIRKESFDFWQFVQGGIERNENPEEAFGRELKEETGISKFEIIGKSKNQFRFDWPEVLRDKKGFAGQIQSFLFVRIKGNPKIKLSKGDKLDDFKWVLINNVNSLIAENFSEIWKKIKKELFEILKR